MVPRLLIPSMSRSFILFIFIVLILFTSVYGSEEETSTGVTVKTPEFFGTQRPFWVTAVFLGLMKLVHFIQVAQIKRTPKKICVSISVFLLLLPVVDFALVGESPRSWHVAFFDLNQVCVPFTSALVIWCYFLSGDITKSIQYIESEAQLIRVFSDDEQDFSGLNDFLKKPEFEELDDETQYQLITKYLIFYIKFNVTYCIICSCLPARPTLSVSRAYMANNAANIVIKFPISSKRNASHRLENTFA